MALSALDDLSREPDDKQAKAVLGSAWKTWSTLVKWLGADDGAGCTAFEWNSSGKKYGWGYRAKIKKRNIAYLIPQEGSFLVGLVLGGKAMDAVREIEDSLPADVMEVINDAPKYGEGTGFRLPIGGPGDLDAIRTLVRIKIDH